MHPVDHVVAHVHRVGVVWQQLDAERVAEAGRLERLGPPHRALAQGRTHRLRRAGVDVVDDRLDRRRHGGVGLPLLEPMPRDVAAVHRLTQRRCVVLEGGAEEPDAGVEAARTVAVVRQPDQAVVLTERHRLAACSGRDLTPRLVRREGQEHLDLGVVGERPGALEPQRAALGVEPIGAAVAAHPPRRVGGVAHEERRRVDQDAGVLADLDRQGREHGRRERLRDGEPLARAVGEGAEPEVLRRHQHAGPRVAESDHVLRPQRAAVQADRVGAEPRGLRGRVQQVLAEARHVQVDLGRALVDVEVDEAAEAPHRLREGRDRLGVCAWRRGFLG